MKQVILLVWPDESYSIVQSCVPHILCLNNSSLPNTGMGSVGGRSKGPGKIENIT